MAKVETPEQMVEVVKQLLGDIKAEMQVEIKEGEVYLEGGLAILCPEMVERASIKGPMNIPGWLAYEVVTSSGGMFEPPDAEQVPIYDDTLASEVAVQGILHVLMKKMQAGAEERAMGVHFTQMDAVEEEWSKEAARQFDDRPISDLAGDLSQSSEFLSDLAYDAWREAQHAPRRIGP